jgi:chemotaxis protein histidine kinase CheA
MDQILAQVFRARRRLWLELFLNRLFTCLFAALAVAIVAIAVPKIVAVPNLPAHWTWWCAIGGIGGGTVAALAWTLMRGLSTLDAAVELDRRFELRERVSSSLALTPEAIETPAGQALLHDAARAIERVEVGSRFGITLPQRRWLPVVTTLFAFVLLSLVENQTAQSGIDPQAAAQAKAQRENVSKELKKRLVERKKKAAAKGLKEASGLFEQLEKETEKLRKNPQADQKKSLVKLNDLAKQLEKRRSEVGSKEEMRKSLANLDKLNKGPAEKMAEAMKNGDWQKALEELKSLNEQLKKGELSEEAKKALAEQLKKLQEKLAETAQAHEKSIDELKKQIQQQQEKGNLAEAGELQQKLDQMQAQQSQMDKLNQLGQKMGQAQEAMKQGDTSKASEAMEQMMQEMESLDAAMQEGEMLDAAMAEMQMAKDAMACKECSGEGCQSCQGNQGNMSRPGNKPGSGMGKGTSWGQRDNSDIDAKFRDSRVRQETGRGASIYAGEADGPNIRGQVSTAVQTEMATSGGTPADPQVIDQLPKSRREHAEEYFNLIREGR